MTKEDVENSVNQLRRLKKIKSGVTSMPVVKLEDFKKINEIEEVLRSRLERAMKG